MNLFPLEYDINWPDFINRLRLPLKLFKLSHSVHWGFNPLSKTPPPSFLPSPPLNQKTVQALSFRQCPLCIGFS